MSSRRERRPSVPPLRFRPQLEAPPQHAVAAPRVPSSVPSHVLLQSASTQSPPQLTPSRSELALMVPAARPAVQPSIVQHIHQQFIVSPCPVATARPVLPSEDLWSVEGLRSAASGQPSASRWRHGRSRTPIAPLAASVDPVGASPAVTAPSQSCHTGLLPSNDAQAAERRKRVAEALEFIASKRQAAAAPAPAIATRAAARGGGHRSPAVQEALDFARALSARQATAALERARAEYEAGVARAALLRRAGRSLDAYELLQSLTPPPPPPAASLGSLAPILPASAPATSSVTTVGTTARGALALADWRSLADSPFSHLPPGDAGALASPVHVITAGMDDLQPGARRARAKALVAAAKLVPFMTIEMLARFLGCPSSTLRDRDRSLVAADAIRIIGSGWSESLINV
ncbi:hypothetical protein AB1Y20_020024 [Prymnesium parvum]|uniref:CDAN1-interacting nuclease 1 n=1 Tax=Prymnesium parvum TaxID=97485 RepID=A0AB34JSI5_PRYPA